MFYQVTPKGQRPSLLPVAEAILLIAQEKSVFSVQSIVEELNYRRENPRNNDERAMYWSTTPYTEESIYPYFCSLLNKCFIVKR